MNEQLNSQPAEIGQQLVTPLPPTNSKKPKVWLWAVGILVVILALGWYGFTFFNKQKPVKPLVTSAPKNQTQNNHSSTVATSIPISNFQAYSNNTLPPSFPVGFPVLSASHQITQSMSMLVKMPGNGASWTKQSTFQFVSSSSVSSVLAVYKNYFLANNWALLPGQFNSSTQLAALNTKTNKDFIEILTAGNSQQTSGTVITVTMSQPQP